MIIFEYVRWRNFLSTGDNFTEVNLNSDPTTLITGANGAGKSTILDALSFGLFGKPHRNINKPQLVNSINDKNCEVEVEFRVGKIAYKIRRGIKPAIFEIYRNGELLPQSSTVKDYQKILEQNVLKFNHKTFHQVVVLGSSSFTPFMQLPTGQRRNIIEDLLDINVFTKMNMILRENVSKLREDNNQTGYEIKTREHKQTIQTKYITDLEKLNDDLIIEKNGEIKEIERASSELEKKAAKLSKTIKAGKGELKRRRSSYENSLKSVRAQLSAIEASIKHQKKYAHFFENNDTCPTCTQDISPEIKEKKISEIGDLILKEEAQSHEYKAETAELEEKREALNKIEQIILNDEKIYSEHMSDIKSNIRSVRNLQAEIQKLQGKTGDVNKAKAELKAIEDDLTHYRNRRIELAEELSYYGAIAEMLKDTGIKTKIIRQYLPVMNNLINQYLQILDFFVSFNLDENFNEVIKSRHRDEFSYASFSEGEKARIDLALLFSWRQIAKMKNSVSTNLLILDETFEASIDNDGVDNLLKILDTLDPQTRIFVISHRGHLLADKFSAGITFEKVNNFSVRRTS
jgi:DNA repair exonuclease SbcCD ATPase subunit